MVGTETAMNKTGETTLQKTPVFDLVEKTFEDVDFKPVGLNCKDWVMIIVKDYAENALFVKQTRWGPESETLEFPCGTVEEGEEPVYAAMRELEEETGLTDYPALEQLLQFNPNPAYFNNKMTVFFTQVEDLTKARLGKQKLDKDEDCKPIIRNLDTTTMQELCQNGMMLNGLAALTFKNLNTLFKAMNVI